MARQGARRFTAWASSCSSSPQTACSRSTYILATGIPDKGASLRSFRSSGFDFLSDVIPTHFLTPRGRVSRASARIPNQIEGPRSMW